MGLVSRRCASPSKLIVSLVAMDNERDKVAVPLAVKFRCRDTRRISLLTDACLDLQYARMKRTTISLPDDLAAALRREADRRRVSVSLVAREAIEARLGWADGEQDVPLIGMFDSGQAHGSLASYVDSDDFKKEYADWIHADAFDRDP